jgi:hypothetical protein
MAPVCIRTVLADGRTANARRSRVNNSDFNSCTLIQSKYGRGWNFFCLQMRLNLFAWLWSTGLDRMDLCSKLDQSQCRSDVENQCRWCEKSVIVPKTGCFSYDILKEGLIDPDTCTELRTPTKQGMAN